MASQYPSINDNDVNLLKKIVNNTAEIAGGIVSLPAIARPESFAGSISAAIASLPPGGTLLLQPTVYTSPYTTWATRLVRDNFSVFGSGIAGYSTDFSHMEGGTIIQGPWFFQGSNLTFKDFGVDCGVDVCAALFGGTAKDGLISSDLNQDLDPWENVTIDSVSILCRANNSGVHACLFENIVNGSITNLTTVRGAAGLVMKGQNINVNGVFARGHQNYSVLVKSDVYAPARKVNLANIIVEKLSSSFDTDGVYVQTSGEDATDININGVISDGCKQAVLLTSSGGDFVRNVNISNVFATDSYVNPIEVSGDAENITISSVIMDVCAYGLKVGASAKRVTITNAIADTTAHDAFTIDGDEVSLTNCKAQDTTGNGFSFGASSSAIMTNCESLVDSGVEIVIANGGSVRRDGVPLKTNSNGVANFYFEADASPVLRNNIYLKAEDTIGTARTVLGFSSGGNIVLNQSGSFDQDISPNGGATTIGSAAATTLSKGPLNGEKDVEATAVGFGFVVKAPNGSRWRLTVDNAGALVSTAL